MAASRRPSLKGALLPHTLTVSLLHVTGARRSGPTHSIHLPAPNSQLPSPDAFGRERLLQKRQYAVHDGRIEFPATASRLRPRQWLTKACPRSVRVSECLRATADKAGRLH